MIKKLLLLLFILLLNACSTTPFSIPQQIDKVTVVKYMPFMKQHRAYFSRSDLLPIKNGKKYLLLYHANKNNLGILLHKKSHYLFYNMSNPEAAPLRVNVLPNTKLSQILKILEKREFFPITSLHKIGYIIKISYQKYKEIKTLLVETKDYSTLQKRYQEAIKNYDASRITHLHTPLPKILISSYLKKYKKLAKSKKQHKQLQRIAQKLKLIPPSKKNAVRSTSSVPPKEKIPLLEEATEEKEEMLELEESSQPEENESIEKISEEKSMIEKTISLEESISRQEKILEEKSAKEVAVKKEKIAKKILEKAVLGNQYNFYLTQSSLKDLNRYISKIHTLHIVSNTQYEKLVKRSAMLQEKHLLKNGSLSELITAYKINKKPKYKERILLLMKEKQLKNSL